MATTRTLLITFIVGVAVMALFAFTLVGLFGEGLAGLALVGVGLRATCALAARVRRISRY